MTKQSSVVITGAGSGIGRALAVEAARRGHHLVLAGRRLELLQETARMAGQNDAVCVTADVTTPQGRASIVAAVGDRMDVLINNAGTLSVGRFSEAADGDLERMVATNLTAPMALTRDLLPALGAAHGRVVNIGSVFGDIAFPFFAGYSATKFGLRGFSDAIRRELSGTGVSVTYIAPRAARTEAETEFGALVEPMAMVLDSADTVARQAWEAIEKGRRESYPKGKERFFVKIQRLLPGLVDKSVGAQARDPRVLAALDARTGETF